MNINISKIDEVPATQITESNDFRSQPYISNDGLLALPPNPVNNGSWAQPHSVNDGLHAPPPFGGVNDGDFSAYLEHKESQREQRAYDLGYKESQ